MANLRSLSQGQIVSPSGRGNLAIAEMLATSNFIAKLEQLSAFQLDALSNKFRPYTESITVQNRDVNGALTTDTYAAEAEVTATQSIIGGKLAYDAAYQRDVNRNLGNFNFDLDLKMKFKAWVKGLEAQMLVGSGAGTPKELKGINTILNGTDNIPGYAETRVIDAASYAKLSGAKSFVLGPGTTTVETIEDTILMLLAAIGSVQNANMIVLRQELWAKLQAIAFSKQVIGYQESNFGTGFQTLFNIPVIPVSAGLTLAEPDNTATPLTTSTSMLVMSAGENNLSWVSQGFAWWDYDVPENKEAGVEKWEFTGNWRITNPKAITRIRNIKA